MWFHYTTKANSFAIDNGYVLTEGQGHVAKCQRNKPLDCYTIASLKPTMTKYIKEKSDCRDESIWKIIEPAFSSSVVEACGNKGCTPNALPNTTLGYCRNWQDFDCSMAQLRKTMANDKRSKKVPCEKLDYAGYDRSNTFSPADDVGHPIFGGGTSSSRIFVAGFFFQSPYTMTLNEEYYVVPTLDLVGIIGGTLGMFIGFSFYGSYSDMVDIIQFLASKINRYGNKIGYVDCSICQKISYSFFQEIK